MVTFMELDSDVVQRRWEETRDIYWGLKYCKELKLLASSRSAVSQKVTTFFLNDNLVGGDSMIAEGGGSW